MKIKVENYKDESQLQSIINLITHDLSEPYSIYVFRYFIHQWYENETLISLSLNYRPELCFLAKENDIIVGTIICKLENHKKYLRGYIAMLAVKKEYRKRGIASKMVEKILSIMKEKNTDEVILETEVTNKEAIILYENFGFIRDKRLHRYYLNTSDAYRLILKFKEPTYSYYQNMQTKK
ncbi:peptide alpha-N-acetyltransferase MAK3 [Pneumocystis jirovecii RU7]|uniref:N-acetyltransferase domain-containing protein n=1 Tax=Pneumocystis jirovecii (strain RU7) TaxID=1408657 RepID=A0A0W4ZRR8_PNEJ7|nr:peptide alpha-N-acetyltransferase MAK3 [Pneumocystis jirovecii RU7]KTW31052.1 hypothetical protein T551_01604 [Pneumocystis jirovecii RU7]